MGPKETQEPSLSIEQPRNVILRFVRHQLTPPPPRHTPPPLHHIPPPQPRPRLHPPRPRESRGLRPSCRASLRTTLAAWSWLSRSTRCSCPSTWTPTILP